MRIEVGGKYNGRGFDVNLAVFQQSFDDFQLNLFNGIAFEVDTVNSCSDDLNGADTDNSGSPAPAPASSGRACARAASSSSSSPGRCRDVDAQPRRHLRQHALSQEPRRRRRRRHLGAAVPAAGPPPVELGGVHRSPARPAGPRAIGASGLRGLIYVDARHSSEFNTGSDLDREKLQKAYTVVNGRIGIRGPDQRWAVELWAQNILDKNYKQVAFDAPLQGAGTVRGVEQGFYPRSTQLFGAFLAEPRTYGLTLRARISPPKAAPAECRAAAGAAAAGDADLPRRQRHPGDRRCARVTAAAAPPPAPVPAPERG